jgi:hypothetical protein
VYGGGGGDFHVNKKVGLGLIAAAAIVLPLVLLEETLNFSIL